MQDKIYDIDLDIRNNYVKHIEVNQGDVATNLFSIMLKDEEEIYNLDDTNVSIIFVKSDLTQVLQTSEDEVQPILVEDNIIKVRLKPQATSKSGKVLAEVIVKNAEGKRLVSKIFSFYVLPALFNDELLESNSDFEILTTLINTVTTLLQEQVLFNIAEAERVLNENDRKLEEVERIALFNKMTTLQSELITLKDSIGDLKLDDLHLALTILKTDLEAIQVEMTNSTVASIEATTQAIQAIEGANTATANTTLAKDEAIRETTKTKQATSDVRALEASVIEAEDDRVVEEGKRATAETTREDTFIASQSVRASVFASKINEFIEETERVESLYPLQLNEIKDNLTAHKENYAKLVDDVTELSYITQKYTVDSWQKVQDIVRAGLGDKAFRIGDQFVATYAGVEYAWDVIGINHDKPTDKSKNYSLTIQSRDCILNAKIDEPEALYCAEVELPAGDYHFINSYESNKPFHFTLTKAIPVGGIILISEWSTNTPTQIRTFADKITTTAIETLSLIEGSTGAQLTSINDIRRCQYGSSNYMESAIKPWLNSESDLFNWESKTKYDRPPIGLPYTGAGFLNLLDSDLAKVIGAVDKQVARNTVTDVGGQDLFSDKVFFVIKSRSV